jgi:hypothetical protein
MRFARARDRDDSRMRFARDLRPGAPERFAGPRGQQKHFSHFVWPTFVQSTAAVCEGLDRAWMLKEAASRRWFWAQA